MRSQARRLCAATVRHRLTGEDRAMKTIVMEDVGAKTMADLRLEIDAMKRLDHPNIVRLYGSYEDAGEQTMRVGLALLFPGPALFYISALFAISAPMCLG